MVYPPSPASISGRTNESDGEVQDYRTRGPDHDSPMAYGVHRRHGDTSPGASTRSNGRGQVRESRVSVPALTVAARSLLAEPRAPDNEATWMTLKAKAKFPEEDRNSVQAAAAAARMASVTESEEGSGPTWRPEGEFNPQVAFGVINSRTIRSGE